MLDYDAVIKGNIDVHRKEAFIYDFIHQEIWNRAEQKRLKSALGDAERCIEDCKFEALDFGAGTGNVTNKLLDMGFKVTAVDISPEMCQVLATQRKDDVKAGNLKVLNLNIDHVAIKEKFDLVTCYSVLHHVPNYLDTLRTLGGLVKKGGVLFCDHEGSGVYPKRGMIGKLILRSHGFVNDKLFHVFLHLHRVHLPNLDYSLSDVTSQLDWQRIITLLRQEGFAVARKNYYEHRTKFNTPLDYLHQAVVGSNTTLLLAKKLVV